MKQTNLDRFLKAQASVHNVVAAELRQGKKKTHWMWYIFPQLKGLGVSENSNYYGIDGLQEAFQYINNKTLKTRYVELCNILLQSKSKSIEDIMGVVDAQKLHSSLTLFSLVASDTTYTTIDAVLDKYYKGQYDDATLKLLNF